MANRVQAVKRVRQAERRTAVNRVARTRLRHQIRSMRRALAAKEPGDLKTIMNGTFSVIDRAARKGHIKCGTAARYKSRIHKRVKTVLGDVAK